MRTAIGWRRSADAKSRDSRVGSASNSTRLNSMVIESGLERISASTWVLRSVLARTSITPGMPRFTLSSCAVTMSSAFMSSAIRFT